MGALWAYRREALTHFIQALDSPSSAAASPSAPASSSSFASSSSASSSSASSSSASSSCASSSSASSSSASSSSASSSCASSSSASSSSASSSSASSSCASSSSASSSSASSSSASSSCASSSSASSSSASSSSASSPPVADSSPAGRSGPGAASSAPCGGVEVSRTSGAEAARELLREELSVTQDAIGKKSAKCYCLWSHRTWVLGQLLVSFLRTEASLFSAGSPSSSSAALAEDAAHAERPEGGRVRGDGRGEAEEEADEAAREAEQSRREDFEKAVALLEEEVKNCDMLLLRRGEDGRNFHCWQHRAQIGAWRIAIERLRPPRKSDEEASDPLEAAEAKANNAQAARAPQSVCEGEEGRRAAAGARSEEAEGGGDEEERGAERESVEKHVIEATMALTKELIEKDFSNYSAWSQRVAGLALGLADWEAELDWLWQGLYTEPNDQTLWKVYTFLVLRAASRRPCPSLLSVCSLPRWRPSALHGRSSSPRPASGSSSPASLSSAPPAETGGMPLCFSFSAPCAVDASHSSCFLRIETDAQDCGKISRGRSIAGTWLPLSPLIWASTAGVNPTVVFFFATSFLRLLAALRFLFSSHVLSDSGALTAAPAAAASLPAAWLSASLRPHLMSLLPRSFQMRQETDARFSFCRLSDLSIQENEEASAPAVSSVWIFIADASAVSLSAHESTEELRDAQAAAARERLSQRQPHGEEETGERQQSAEGGKNGDSVASERAAKRMRTTREEIEVEGFIALEFVICFSRFACAFDAGEQRPQDCHLVRLPKGLVARLQASQLSSDSASSASLPFSPLSPSASDSAASPPSAPADAWTARRVRFLVAPPVGLAAFSSPRSSSVSASSFLLSAAAAAPWRVLAQQRVQPGSTCALDGAEPQAQAGRDDSEARGAARLSDVEELRNAFVTKELEKIDELLELEPSCKLAIEAKWQLLQAFRPQSSLEEQVKLCRAMAAADPHHKRLHDNRLLQLAIRQKILAQEAESHTQADLDADFQTTSEQEGEGGAEFAATAAEGGDRESVESETQDREIARRLHTLDLSSMGLQRLPYPVLSDISHKLERLILRGNFVSDLFWADSHVPVLPNLRELDLRENKKITLLSPVIVALADLPLLTRVDLAHTGLRPRTAEERSPAFQLLTQLLRLREESLNGLRGKTLPRLVQEKSEQTGADSRPWALLRRREADRLVVDVSATQLAADLSDGQTVWSLFRVTKADKKGEAHEECLLVGL
ncbi:hypothetical protein BESB_035830 [Besnoitia besnoiti]|uniref:protein geranylgeranyltransferase type II n=1 Tax=Besnoitia besnoiti TaxID=94643 RepID=A0A2A9MGM0_BESBE|nr:hypothetical protein BESB_035830 [Besnoitia besnoiti]PFH37125.1 hypothetical protein BESB_035830 [Besnoitia besnoiti]